MPLSVQYLSLCFKLRVPNSPFQRTRATKRLGVFGFCGVARGIERGRWAVALRALIRGTIREDYSAYGESVERRPDHC